MNTAFFLKPKSEVVFLYDDMPLAQALDAMRSKGYASVPVIDREGRYLNTVSEGDFLAALAQTDGEHLRMLSAQEAEGKKLSSILRDDRNPPSHIGDPVEALLTRTAAQNFVPIVDDRGVFIGIVTRRAVIHYFLREFSACAR